MALRLSIENHKQLPDGGPITYTLNAKRTIEIGRDQYHDWVLPDATRVISGKHCEIRCQDGGYWLVDTSTNGTYLNGSDQRVQSPYRLHDGDRITIAHYIIAVSLDEPAGAAASPLAPVQDSWADEIEVAPPIDRKLLMPQKEALPRVDYLDWAADLPPAPRAPSFEPDARAAPPSGSLPVADVSWLPEAEPAPRPPEPPRMPAATPLSWLPEAAEPVPEPASIFTDKSRLAPDAESPWTAPEPVRPAPAPPPPSAPHPAVVEASPVAAAPPPASRPEPADAGEFLRRFAQGAGIPPSAIAARDGGEFAESLGRLMHLVAGNVKALLAARQNAKQMTRGLDQTTIAAFDNNPLKFSPSVEDALAIMFGPPRRSYLNAEQCFAESLDDLAEHMALTYAAMQQAVQILQSELEPASIEQSVPSEKGLAAIVGSRHGRLWDAYVARWQARTKRDGLIGAFMLDFSASYNAPRKGKD